MIYEPRVSVIIPYIRPDKVRRCIKAVLEEVDGLPGIKTTVAAEEDKDRIGCPKMVKRMVDESAGQAVAFLGDDTIPQLGWLSAALKAMATLPDGYGLVGLNDGHNDGNVLATHWLADKRLLPLLDGEFFHTGYRHCFCDQELMERCKELGRYVWAEDARYEHDHPQMRGETTEGTDYEWAYRPDNFLHGRRLFLKRQKNGWKS